MKKQLVTAKIHGMCGGVFSALRILENVIAENTGKPIYVLHELVHNHTVTAELERRGVKFVDSLQDIPQGSAAVIGAHGVSAEVKAELEKICSSLADATCPLVRKLQCVAAGLNECDQLVIFGKKGHPEVIGVAGHSRAGETFIVADKADIEALPELASPVFLSQTTVDAERSDEAMQLLVKRFPHIKTIPGVCDASRQRQAAVKELARRCPVVIIAGSPHSSNACRLQELAARQGAKAFRVDGADELPVDELRDCPCVGLSSGASTPESVFEKIVARLHELGFSS